MIRFVFFLMYLSSHSVKNGLEEARGQIMNGAKRPARGYLMLVWIKVVAVEVEVDGFGKYYEV